MTGCCGKIHGECLRLSRRPVIFVTFRRLSPHRRPVRPAVPPHGSLTMFTTCFSVFDVLPEQVESPAYTALIEVVPTFSVEIVKLAEPRLKIPDPNTVLAFMNVTVSPSGGAPTAEETTAVKVTACP